MPSATPFRGWNRIFVAILVVVSGCAEKRPAKAPAGTCRNELPVVSVHGAKGVVLPSAVSRRALLLRRKDVESFFVPSEDDVLAAETGLLDGIRARLAAAKSEPPSAERDRETAALSQIVDHFGQFLRQYAGVVVGGSRRVLVNAFPEDTYCYRDDYVAIDDGGAWFWNIQYDLAVHQYLHWQLAGE
jgi:hypothetical protein